MIRKFGSAVVLAALMLGSASAELYDTKVKEIDIAKMTLVIDKDAKSFTISDKVKIEQVAGAGRRLKLDNIKDGLKILKPGDAVVLSTERLDGKEIITEIVIQKPATAVLPKKKKDKN